MAAGGDERCDFYAVMGLKKECTETELRNAYKKLALKWHPDRCSATANVKFVEEAKKKFQAVQEAYSVLSDANKRFLYDVGVYDCDDDDDEEGMAGFLNEMADMMRQNKPNENGGESFEDLQNLFHEMFHSDIDAYGLDGSRSTTSSSASSYASSAGSSNFTNKRGSSEMCYAKPSGAVYPPPSGFTSQFEGFSFGTGGTTRKQTQESEKIRRNKNGLKRSKK